MQCFPCVPRVLAGPKSIEDIKDKTEFIAFMKKACSSKETDEYKVLYKFLLKVFRQADRDFDGLVGSDDFDIMVEMAGAIPRNFGLAPSSVEQFPSSDKRGKYRQELFRTIDSDQSGSISFNEWLGYTYNHIKEKIEALDSSVHLRMDTKDHFKDWVVASCRDRKSLEYKDLYGFLLDVFVEADADMDGMVNFEEFDRMIEVAAVAPRKFGYAPPTETMHKTPEERVEHRKAMFTKMDTENNNAITFQEWLTFCYAHICEKAKTLDDSLSGVPPAKIMQQKSTSLLGSW